MIHVENRALVVPGQLLAEGDFKVGRGAYREGNSVFSSVVGLAEIKGNEISVIALEGSYEPRVGDKVIGVVVDQHPYGWKVDISAPYLADLPRDLSETSEPSLHVGDLMLAEVEQVTELKKVRLSIKGKGCGKLEEGYLIEITPVKTPRVVGKRRSMLTVLQSVGETELVVGQNGRILVKTKDERRLSAIMEAIRRIEREAHTTGLTDRIKTFLTERMGHGEKAADN